MNDDRVIRFPGTQTPEPGKPAAKKTTKEKSEPPTGADAAAGLDALDEDRRKALSVIMSGMPFVCIGIQPTATGADFFTSLGGDHAEIVKAQPHLAGVIERLLQRRGLLS